LTEGNIDSTYRWVTILPCCRT